MLAPSVLTSGVAADAKELDRRFLGFRADRGGDVVVGTGVEEPGVEMDVEVAVLSPARLTTDFLAAFRIDTFWRGSTRLGMLKVLRRVSFKVDDPGSSVSESAALASSLTAVSRAWSSASFAFDLAS